MDVLYILGYGSTMYDWEIRLSLRTLNKNAKSITLYGFDWELTPTYYNPFGYKTPHDYKQEEELVRFYEKSGILTVKGE